VKSGFANGDDCVDCNPRDAGSTSALGDEHAASAVTDAEESKKRERFMAVLLS